MEMKIFELRWTAQNEKEWITGRTIIEALKNYVSTVGIDFLEMEDEDDIVEVPKEEWAKMIVRNTEFDEKDPNDFEEMSFEEWIKENKSPGIIAGTMYT